MKKFLSLLIILAGISAAHATESKYEIVTSPYENLTNNHYRIHNLTDQPIRHQTNILNTNTHNSHASSIVLNPNDNVELIIPTTNGHVVTFTTSIIARHKKVTHKLFTPQDIDQKLITVRPTEKKQSAPLYIRQQLKPNRDQKNKQRDWLKNGFNGELDE